MKINLEQGSEEWVDWRKQGLGGSDASKLMGSSYLVYNTVTTLWKDKVGLAPDFVMNSAVAHGMKYEAEARDFYQKVTGNEVFPDCFCHDEFDYLRASMDGITKDGSIAVEIKVPQEKNWLNAKKGVLKEYYYSQIQHQLLVTGAKTCDYWVYNVEEGACHFEVPRCEPYMDEILSRSKRFWEEFVLTEKCPVSADFNIDDRKLSDPFTCSGMDFTYLGFRPNLDKITLF